MLYPPTRVCDRPFCTNPRLLRDKDEHKVVTVFTLDRGVLQGFRVKLYCNACRTYYRHDYAVHQGVRTYYAGYPEYVEVALHTYIEVRLLRLFTALTLLSWTSATNAAHVYHEVLSLLSGPDRHKACYKLRPEHVWDGFTALALLRDADERSYAMELPHTGEQRSRFTVAMEARNAHMRCAGQPEFNHWCERCHRRYNEPDGSVAYVDALVCDGIEMGRPCCSVPHCTMPLASTQDRFCPGHSDQALLCVVDCCSAPAQEGHKTCSDPAHRALEDRFDLQNKAQFHLRDRLQRNHPGQASDSLRPDAPSDDIIEVDASQCPEKPDVGHKVRAAFGRTHTHNEQLFVRPCGMIPARETCHTSESIRIVLEFFRKYFPDPRYMPRFLVYDNGCRLYQHLEKAGDPLKDEVAFPVDVFHWKCKHKKSDDACSIHCNPYSFPELLAEDGDGWFFNTSIAEQTNVWFGGFHAIVREMTATRFDFFLDEMIKQRNALTRDSLEAAGWTPGARV
ncbi:hypothetical protein C8Q80DRAFT_1112092 [Daedaleopsis nitida]|nr:hypothetical protein C8Q80DRAFT_1112092 [Daedaleopsis nitida]